MRSLLRDLGEFAGVYIVGIAVSLFWVFYGVYIYFGPLPVGVPVEANFMQDIGSSFIAQGVIFLFTFIGAGIYRLAFGRHEREQQRKDREMLRELHQILINERNKNTDA